LDEERGNKVTAMRPYSSDLRERIAAAVDHHDGSIRSIARAFRVSTSFVVRLLQRRRAAGTLDPEPHRGGRPPALGPGDLERLAGLVRERPDATLEQLRQRVGFTCRLKALWFALDRLGLTRKKFCRRTARMTPRSRRCSRRSNRGSDGPSRGRKTGCTMPWERCCGE